MGLHTIERSKSKRAYFVSYRQLAILGTQTPTPTTETNSTENGQSNAVDGQCGHAGGSTDTATYLPTTPLFLCTNSFHSLRRQRDDVGRRSIPPVSYDFFCQPSLLRPSPANRVANKQKNTPVGSDGVLLFSKNNGCFDTTNRRFALLFSLLRQPAFLRLATALF